MHFCDFIQTVRVIGLQDFLQLITDAFCGQILCAGGIFPYGDLGQFIDGKIIAGGKTQCTVHPQGILIKADVRIADTADDPSVQIVHSVKWINQITFRRYCHGIDGKISAAQVCCQIRDEGDVVRMAVILILIFFPKSGDFHFVIADDDGHRSVLDPGRS